MDLNEFNFFPKCQEIASNIHVQRENIEGDVRSKYLVALDKQEEEVTKTISEITLKMDNLKKLRDSDDVYLVATYKFGAD